MSHPIRICTVFFSVGKCNQTPLYQNNGHMQIQSWMSLFKYLTLVLLTLIYPAFANSIDPDQLASENHFLKQCHELINCNVLVLHIEC